MDKLLKALSDALGPLVNVVTTDIFIYSVLGLIGIAFVVGLILDACSPLAKTARQINMLSKRIRYFGLENGAVDLIENVSKVKGIKKQFLKFMSQPEEAPSKYFTFDQVTMSLGGTHKNIVFYLICGIALAVTFLFGGVYFTAQKITVFNLFTILALEALLVGVFGVILKVVGNKRLKDLHNHYYEFAYGLDKVTESLVEEYGCQDDLLQEEEYVSQEAVQDENPLQNADYSSDIAEVFDYNGQDMHDGLSIRPLYIKRTELDEKAVENDESEEEAYENPYLREETKLTGRDYITTNSIENAAKGYIREEQEEEKAVEMPQEESVYDNALQEQEPQPDLLGEVVQDVTSVEETYPVEEEVAVASQPIKGQIEIDMERIEQEEKDKKGEDALRRIQLAALKKKKEELEKFLQRTKAKATPATPSELVDKAKVAENLSAGDDDSLRTMQQVALLLQKEREKKNSKSVDDQRRMNEALADLLRAMGKKSGQ